MEKLERLAIYGKLLSSTASPGNLIISAIMDMSDYSSLESRKKSNSTSLMGPGASRMG